MIEGRGFLSTERSHTKHFCHGLSADEAEGAGQHFVEALKEGFAFAFGYIVGVGGARAVGAVFFEGASAMFLKPVWEHCFCPAVARVIERVGQVSYPSGIQQVLWVLRS